MQKLNDEKLDYLKEIATVGSGHAATALSQLISEKVSIEVPSVMVMNFEQLHLHMEKIAVLTIGLKLETFGDMPGNILVFFSEKSEEKLVRILKGKKEASVSKEMAHSVLKEVSSILSGAYIGAISKMTDLNLTLSVPKLLIDMPGAIIDEALIDVGRETEYAVVFETLLKVEHQKLSSYFVFLISPERMDALLKSLGRFFNK